MLVVGRAWHEGRQPQGTGLSPSAIAFVLIAVLLIAVGCGGRSTVSPSPSIVSGVEGRVVTAGGPASREYPPTAQPYPWSEVRAVDSSGTVVASIKVNPDATFRLELPPGTYTLKARPTSGNPSFDPCRVSVRPGQFSHVDLTAQVP